VRSDGEGPTASKKTVPFLDSLKYKASKKSMKIAGINFVPGAIVKVDGVLFRAGKNMARSGPTGRAFSLCASYARFLAREPSDSRVSI
jgi:hypothetical protein